MQKDTVPVCSRDICRVANAQLRGCAANASASASIQGTNSLLETREGNHLIARSGKATTNCENREKSPSCRRASSPEKFKRWSSLAYDGGSGLTLELPVQPLAFVDSEWPVCGRRPMLHHVSLVRRCWEEENMVQAYNASMIVTRVLL